MEKNIIKLDANENMVEHDWDFNKCLSEVNPNLYPDVNIVELRSVLSKKYNVPMDEIYCSNGSDYLIKVLTFTLVSYKDEILIPEVAFPTYEIAAKIKECSYKLIPLLNFGIDLKATLNAITESTKLIWLSNPHNPTGTLLSQCEIEDFLDKVPSDVAVVMDEAYIEYLNGNPIDSIGLFNKYSNLIILRTLSKGYGIAGARVGYGFAHKPFMDKLKRMIGPFDLNSYAQKVAVELLSRDGYIEKVRESNNYGIKQYSLMCNELGFKYVDTHTSFIVFETSKATELTQCLKEKGIIVKDGIFIGMPGWIRVSIGTKEQNEIVIREIKDFFRTL